MTVAAHPLKGPQAVKRRDCVAEDKKSFLSFHPGVAAEKLAELSVGKTKIGVLRSLLDAAAWPEERDFSPYVRLTRLGRRIKRHSGEQAVVLECAREALAVSKAFRYVARRSCGKDYTRMPRGSASFKLRVSGQQALKLKVLAVRAGLTKTMALRFLVLGLPLPDRLAMRTAGRMGQVGGLLRHVAYGHKTGAWREIVGISWQISAIGLVIAESETANVEVGDDRNDL